MEAGSSEAPSLPNAVDEKPLPVSWKVPQDKLQVVVETLHCNLNPKAPYVRLTLGDQSFQTARADEAQGNWNESFLFQASFHTKLFGVLQLDVYEARTLLPDLHLGRAELKLGLIFGLPDDFSSWYELWRKDHSLTNMTETRRRSVLSTNVGAIQVRLRHQFNSEFSPDLYTKLTDVFRSVKPVTLDELYQRPAQVNLMPPSLTNEPMPLSPRRRSVPSIDEIREQEALVHESLEFLYHEDQTLDPPPVTLMDRIGGLILSKETNQVLKAIRRVLLAYGQGLELTNAQMLSGIVQLEKFYVNKETKRTGEIIRQLEAIERPRHFYKFALAAYGWKGLNFFGKGSGIIKDSTRKDADRKAVLEYLRIPEANLLAFELLTVDLFRPSYFIVLDDITNSLVLTIRGTMNATDTLTDLVC